MTIDELKEYTQSLKSVEVRWMKRNNPEGYDYILSVTDFLPDNVPMKERIYCFINDITSNPLCKKCNDVKVSYDYKGNTNAGYKSYCSSKCFSNSDEVIEKRKRTNLEKYGVDNPAKSDVIKDKIKAVMVERYGVESYLQTVDAKNKAKEAMIEKYGTEHYMQSVEGKAHYKKVCFDKYGVDGYQTSESYNLKLKNTNMRRYGVEYSYQAPSVKSKIKNINLEKYDRITHKQKHISTESLELLENKEWLEEQYTNLKTPTKCIADECGVNQTTVVRYLNKHQIPITKHGFSQAEKEIITFIQDHYTGTILENDRQIIKPLELDIVLPELKIAIEYCGLYWHSHIYKDKNYHLNKLNECNAKGYRLITIFEDEWVHHKDIYKGKLLNILHLQETTRVFARKTSVVPVSNKDKKAFFNAYHIQGTGGGSVTYGLTHEGTLTSVMTFKYHKKSDSYELSRFANSCNVVGGFSKLVKHFQKEYPNKEIFSFADRRWSEGEVYLNNGFIIDKFNPPDYKYVVGDTRKHKYNFRRNKLEAKLTEFDPLLTEWENTENHGLYRIYDCGLIRFTLT